MQVTLSHSPVITLFVVTEGDLVSVYTSLGYHHAVSDVQFHPLDHIIAFCSFGDSHPVLVYHYDPKGRWHL